MTHAWLHAYKNTQDIDNSSEDTPEDRLYREKLKRAKVLEEMADDPVYGDAEPKTEDIHQAYLMADHG